MVIMRAIVALAVGCALVLGLAPTLHADEPAQILVIRGDTHCPGIPGLDVRLDGQTPAIVGAGEYVRMPVAPGEHHLAFFPANPEHIALTAGERGVHAFLVTSFRLGWRCKFGVEALAADAVAQHIHTAQEISLTLARTANRPLPENRGQMTLKQP